MTMLYNSAEVRSELIRIIPIPQLEFNSEGLKRDSLFIEEKMGKFRYEEVEEIKNRVSLFNLRDQPIYNGEIHIKHLKTNKRSNFSLCNLLMSYFSYGGKTSKNEGQINKHENTMGDNNTMRTSHYFLFKDMVINSVGTYLALLTDNQNEHLLMIINLKTFRHITLSSLQEIVSFHWHPINVTQLSYSTHSYTKHYTFSSDNESFFTEIASIEHMTPSSLIKWLPAPNGQMSLLVTSSHLSIYDINYKLFFEKTFVTKCFKSCKYAPNSSYFLLYTNDELYIFNAATLDFKSYSNFPGTINDVLISENSNYIYIILTQENTVLMYTLYNYVEDDYNVSVYQSYNNTSLAYVHSTFKMFYHVHQLLTNIQQLEKIEFTGDNKRLGLMYRSDMGERYLALYEVNIGDSVHQFKIQPMIILRDFKGYSVKDFTMSYDYNPNAPIDTIYINWNDRFISRAMINSPL